ncbi:MAG: hypothetical protein QJR09_07500 [Micrococcus sp.]|nr:hypothetical protein [Micrococcus sp.]
MSTQIPDEPTRPASDTDADRGPDTPEGGSEEWTGGHQKQRPPQQDAQEADLPDLEEDEDSIVRPENS